jgi:streptogrisin C
MRRTRFALVGFSILLAVCGVAGTSSAVAESGTTPEPSPGLLAAMRDEFGLTTQQAKTRLAQESEAARLEPLARGAAGEAFGGAWFDPALGKLVVALTDQAKASAVRATGAETTIAQTTEAALAAAKAAIDAESRTTPAPPEVAGWRTDVRTGTVEIDVLSGARSPELDRFLAAANKAGPVTVHPTASVPRTFSAGTVGGDPYYINGNTRCSIGFSVQGGFVSAGHCGGAGSSVVGWDGSAMGSFAASSFPGNDYSFIRISNGWYTVPVVLGWGTVSDVLVRGSAEAPVGASICRSGSTTHWHCGTVAGKNETVNYSQGAVYQMTRTSVCAEPGDSGGSFISGDQAQGVTSGGSGNCSSGGTTFFQPVNEILGAYGLSLVTA